MRKKPKPHVMWIVAIPLDRRMWPLTDILSFQRRGAIEQCEKVFGESWAHLRKDRELKCLKVSLALPAPRSRP